MKKPIVFIIVACLSLMLFSACGSKTPSSGNDTPGTSMPSNAQQSSEKPADNSGTSIGNTSTSKIKSLDDIKKLAEAEGLEISELHAMQKNSDTVGGFTVVYGDTYLPVYEFKTEEEALEYAQKASNGGYNLGIINGRFVTMCGASYGIVEDDAEKDTLMKIMDGTLIEMTENNAHVAIGDGSTDSKSYHDAYALLDVILKSMNETTGKMIEQNNKAHPSGDAQTTEGVITGAILLSIDLAFTAYFMEDQTQLDSIAPALEYLGSDGKITWNAAHDYTITAKNANSGAAIEIHGVYDPSTKALRMTSTENGTLKEFYEFVPLGGDKYAFQTPGERAVVVYKDGAVTSFTYTAIYDVDDAKLYDADADSIYPSGEGADETWVTENGADSYDQYFSFDGNILKVNAAQSFSDERIKVEIPK